MSLLENQNLLRIENPEIRGSKVKTFVKLPNSSGPVKPSVIGVLSKTFFT